MPPRVNDDDRETQNCAVEALIVRVGAVRLQNRLMAGVHACRLRRALPMCL